MRASDRPQVATVDTRDKAGCDLPRTGRCRRTIPILSTHPPLRDDAAPPPRPPAAIAPAADTDGDRCEQGFNLIEDNAPLQGRSRRGHDKHVGVHGLLILYFRGYVRLTNHIPPLGQNPARADWRAPMAPNGAILAPEQRLELQGRTYAMADVPASDFTRNFGRYRVLFAQRAAVARILSSGSIASLFHSRARGIRGIQALQTAPPQLCNGGTVR